MRAWLGNEVQGRCAQPCTKLWACVDKSVGMCGHAKPLMKPWACVNENTGMHGSAQPLAKAQGCMGAQHVMENGACMHEAVAKVQACARAHGIWPREQARCR